jgi:hypothetical protein
MMFQILGATEEHDGSTYVRQDSSLTTTPLLSTMRLGFKSVWQQIYEHIATAGIGFTPPYP